MSFLSFLDEKYQDRIIAIQYRPLLGRVLDRVRYFRSYEPLRLMATLRGARERLKRNVVANPRRLDEFLPDAFAIFSQTAKIIFGYEPNASQLYAGILLWRGKVVEMRTGEGKTLAAAMPAYLQALSGKGMHVITTNDYLARRDGEWMRRIFDELGVAVGIVVERTDRPARAAEYAKDITYVANQEIGFDYLRDNLVIEKNERVLRGFPYAIIDEVDSILIDEARTSLIISEAVKGEQSRAMPAFLDTVNKLVPNEDYEIDLRFKTVFLTPQGIEKATRIIGRDIFRASDPDVLEAFESALYARAFFKENRDYVIKDGRVILVDEFTGHPKWDYRLPRGLQQMVERTAGVKESEENIVTASITYRALYKMYAKVGGMSGTARAARDELFDLYGLDVCALAPHRGMKRRDLATIFFRTEKEKIDFLIKDIEEVHRTGAPILVVGRTVLSAKRLSDSLRSRGLPHQLLHAEVAEHEFEIIKNAGKRGAITIATNMAGRGADIVVDQEYKKKSGLMVYAVEPNLSSRIDEQLRGRAGRQGEMGRTRLLASLEDEIFHVYGEEKLWRYAEAISWEPTGIIDPKLYSFLKTSQDIADAIAAEERERTAELDGIVDIEREFIYWIRNTILEAGEWFDLIRGLHTIFIEDARREHILAVNFREAATRRLAQEFPGTEGVVRNLTAAVCGDGATSYEGEKDLPVLPVEASLILRRALLETIDAEWINYLETIDRIKDQVMLEAAIIDPAVNFVAKTSVALRNMREQFAIDALRMILLTLQQHRATSDSS
ncbi:hypothetical protein HY504_03565 [Candidatus Wolfebacteria bacterium]|nr:hypothetical protein [Candidatus Wolfebacteria bacterium]